MGSTKISTNQTRHLERLQDLIRDRFPQRIILDRFNSYLTELNAQKEDIDPMWLDIWDKFDNETINRYLEPEKIEFIKKIFEPLSSDEEELFKIELETDERIAFLLGAGMSVPSNIPAVKDLLSELWKKAKRIGREDFDDLASWCLKNNITNIEDLLTAAYISNFAARNDSLTSLLDYFLFPRNEAGKFEREEYYLEKRSRFRPSTISSISLIQDTLQTLFSLLTDTMILAEPNKAHQAVVEFIQKHPKASVITTNYDGCMDEAILKANLTPDNLLEIGKDKVETDSIKLIKMHGSIYWAYCDSCLDAKSFDLLKIKEAYDRDSLSYPVMGICRKCGGLRRPMLVPPLSLKFVNFPNLIDIWSEAKDEIFKAKYIITVGYSFSEADSYIAKIVHQSMATNTTQKIIVINPDKSVATILRKKLESAVDGFDSKRIIQLNKSCDEALPELLPSLINPRAKNK